MVFESDVLVTANTLESVVTGQRCRPSNVVFATDAGRMLAALSSRESRDTELAWFMLSRDPGRPESPEEKALIALAQERGAEVGRFLQTQRPRFWRQFGLVREKELHEELKTMPLTGLAAIHAVMPFCSGPVRVTGMNLYQSDGVIPAISGRHALKPQLLLLRKWYRAGSIEVDDVLRALLENEVAILGVRYGYSNGSYVVRCERETI